jgi:hypothetical protein
MEGTRKCVGFKGTVSLDNKTPFMAYFEDKDKKRRISDIMK